jgi:hypothetical protein
MSLRSPALQTWLNPDAVGDSSYRHSLLREVSAERAAGLQALADLVVEAHRDSRERLERLVGISLDPVTGSPPTWPPFPDALHTTVLQGYLGEIFAGLIAENWLPHGKDWTVPAFLFRGHLAAYQQLERNRQLGGPARPTPGRTGDDALAFALDENDAIVAWMWGEAKCTHEHDSSLIAAGHRQLSSEIRVPVDLIQLIEVLQESRRPDRDRWVSSLRELLRSDNPPPRFDLFVYVCGRQPRRKLAWVSRDTPDSRYSRSGPLEAVEVQLVDFDAVLRAVYPNHLIERG